MTQAGPPRTPAAAAGPPGSEPAVRRATLHNVQGLRGIAALIVVMAHVSGDHGFEERVFGSSWTSWSNLPANTGVDLFFVISGVIMVVTTWHTFDRPGASRRFILRRIARIYPLYWLVNSAVLSLSLLVPGSVAFDDRGGAHLLQSYLLLPTGGRLPLLVAWSLVFELYFYVVFALALLVGRSRFAWVMSGWVVVTLALTAIAPNATNPYVAIVANPLSLEFVLGVVIGVAAVHGRYVRPPTVLALGVLAFVACLVYLGASGWAEFPSDPVRVALVAVPAALVVYGAIGVEVTGRRLLPRPVQRMGDASYSLYLVHVPALTAFGIVLAGRLPTTPWVHALVVPLVIALVVAAALACYRLAERPLQVLAHRALRALLPDAAPVARVAPEPP